MKSKTKNIIICGLAVLVVVLVMTPIRNSMVLICAKDQRKRMQRLVDLDISTSYEFWKYRIFMAARRRDDTTEQTLPDGDIVYVLTHAKDDMPLYVPHKSVID